MLAAKVVVLDVGGQAIGCSVTIPAAAGDEFGVAPAAAGGVTAGGPIMMAINGSLRPMTTGAAPWPTGEMEVEIKGHSSLWTIISGWGLGDERAGDEKDGSGRVGCSHAAHEVCPQHPSVALGTLSFFIVALSSLGTCERYLDPTTVVLYSPT